MAIEQSHPIQVSAEALRDEPIPVREAHEPLDEMEEAFFEHRARDIQVTPPPVRFAQQKPSPHLAFSRASDRDPLFVHFSALQDPAQMLAMARSQLGFPVRDQALSGLPFVSLRPASVALGVPSDWEAAFFVLCAKNAMATGKLCVLANSLSEIGVGHPACLRALAACAQRSQYAPRILLRREDDGLSKGALSEWLARNPGLAQFRVLPRQSPLGLENRRNFYLGAGPWVARRFDFEQPFGALESDVAQANNLLTIFDSIWHAGIPLFGPQPLMV